MDECPFTILIDSREKRPWLFKNMSMVLRSKMREVEVPTKVVCLGNDNGDYQVEGIPDVTIERKSLEDLYSTLADRESFRRQVEHMHCWLRVSFIIIECSWSEVYFPTKYHDNWKSRLAPVSVFATINSWRTRYCRVHWLAPGSRRMAELSAFEILKQNWEHQNE